ncbi:hypothetical protein WFP14_20585 [Yersinia proxima]|uniref:Lipoprotein n=1 Tax=Yersinia proxima TaxID=2890316 RepID=A0ABW9F3Z1_9GAMM
MFLRTIPLLPVLFLAACSSSTVKHIETQKKNSAAVRYDQSNSRIVPVNSVVSSNNACVDHFNFLRQAGDDKYSKYSRNYIQISDGYRFLSTNKNIMDSDAKRVYTQTLDMKLNTLCSEVNYAGYQLIQQKISALSHI